MVDRHTIAWIANEASDEMLSETQRVLSVETGGVLMGYWGAGTSQPVICSVIGPGPKAVHRATRFRPDQEFHQSEIARMYRESAGAIHYLGDWHSHPGGTVDLSWRDVRALGRISRFAAARLPNPLMLIVGGPPWRLGVWQAVRPLRRIWPDRSAIMWLEIRGYAREKTCPSD